MQNIWNSFQVWFEEDTWRQIQTKNGGRLQTDRERLEPNEFDWNLPTPATVHFQRQESHWNILRELQGLDKGFEPIAKTKSEEFCKLGVYEGLRDHVTHLFSIQRDHVTEPFLSRDLTIYLSD